MTKRIAVIILAAFAICGCQVKEINEFVQETSPNPDAKVFTAIIEDNTSVGTKTVLDNDGNVRWKQGDQVSIFVGSTVNEHYQVTDASEGKTSASLYQVTSPGFVAGTDINNNVAFYPYATTAEIAKSGSSYVISDILLPAVQNYAEGSFGNGAFPMAAVTSSTSDMILKFKNVLGGLKLQLKGTATIASIRITGNNNEILCGAAEVTVSNTTTPTISLSDATAKTVTLDCGEGVQLNTETATPFIIALPPMTMDGGFTVVVTDTEGNYMEIKTTKSQTITRSNMLKMPAVVFEGIPTWAVDLGLPSGTLWAPTNIGASSPEEVGGRYAWGETETKDNYVWGNYKWCNGTSSSMTKYCAADGKTELDDDDDVAQVILGNGWHMPDNNQIQELLSECTWVSETLNGVSGYRVTGPNTNSIFLPCNGQWEDAGLTYASRVYLWSSECYGNGNAYRLQYPDDVNWGYNHRHDGLCVRAVLGTYHDDSPASEPEAVDLGLSVKWATFNLGASKPEEYGDYFAWGDISPRDDVPEGAYAWAVYKWCNGSYSSMQKYNTNSSYGVVDGVTTLTLEDDAAASNWGDNWRMPTAAEQNELLENCTWICTTRNGINGYEVISKVNGNSIFLPAAGYKGDSSVIREDGEVGLYWSSSLTEGSSTYTSCRLRFAENEIDHIDINRSFALQIRPVYSETITPEFVDLGLSSGLKWATCNVGANAPEEYGDYFAWGETEPYYSSQNPLTWKDGKEAGYEWPSYQWYDATNDSQTKYCYGVDNKTVLDLEDDAATVNWGGTWRMPTDADWTELRTECTWTWTTQNGVYGRLVTSNTNGKSIFLPAAGYKSGTGHIYAGSYGEYWSSSLNDYYSYAALYANFSSDGVYRNGHVRCYGRSVRPVTE
ncbi:MAG: hypothetical protein IKX71_07915 [Bacteroidales bacterium]|nr:hypothetical protein [Bacteroidales bacterium]